MDPVHWNTWLARLEHIREWELKETRKLASYIGADGGEITEQMIIDMVPDFGEGDFFEASEAFFSGKLDWALDAIDRHFFQGKDARPLLATLQNRNRLLIQLRVLVDGAELDPNQRLGKDQLERIGIKYLKHFSNPCRKDYPECIFSKPVVPGKTGSVVEKILHPPTDRFTGWIDQSV